MAALLLLQHGLSKFFGFPMPMNAPAMFSLYWFAGVIEIVGGGLLLIGLFSRWAAFILSGELAFAYFLGHAPKGFFPLTNQGEVAVLFCFVFLYLAAAGPGPWSVDASRNNAAA
jgi:putative oxidoreductase